MDIVADAKIPFPRDQVFAVYRDKMKDLLQYLPNVRDIEVKAREDDGDVVRFVNVWHGGGDIPAAARAFLSDAMLSWTDTASWNAKDFTCDWHIAPHAFTEAVECRGKNRFFDEGGATRLEMRGAITIDGKKLRGVPGFLSGKVAKTVEEFLAAKIQPNLVETTKAIETFLQKQKG